MQIINSDPHYFKGIDGKNYVTKINLSGKYETFLNDNNDNNNNIMMNYKLKEYQFDSLVYRYIRAREQKAEYDFYKNSTKEHDKECYYKQARRDNIMRFCQILNEVIGEHEYFLDKFD